MNDHRYVTRSPKVLLALLVTLLVVLASCGGDSDDDADASTNGADAAATDLDDDSSGDSGDGGDADGEWTDADFERLVTTTVDGYTLDSSSVSEYGNATVQYTQQGADGDDPLTAVVTFTNCDPFTCVDLGAELTEEQRTNMRSVLAPVHIDNPDLVEEVSAEQVDGRPALVAYYRSFVEDGGSTATANTYRMTTHDDLHLIAITVTPDLSAGVQADSAEELEQQMTADDAAAVAADILDAFSNELS